MQLIVFCGSLLVTITTVALKLADTKTVESLGYMQQQAFIYNKLSFARSLLYLSASGAVTLLLGCFMWPGLLAGTLDTTSWPATIWGGSIAITAVLVVQSLFYLCRMGVALAER